MKSSMIAQTVAGSFPDTAPRACSKASNKESNESKSEHLSRSSELALTVFPKTAEFVESAEKALCHPTAWQHNKLV